MASLKILALVTAVFVVVSFSDQAAAAQGDCTSSLAPCLPYLNMTTGKAPPATCCTPLKRAVATQKGCICSLFTDPDLLRSLGVNSTQVVDLAESCGVNADPTFLCTAASAPSPAAVAPSPAAVGSTTPAATTPPPPGNGAPPVRSIGIGFWSLVLAWILH